MDKREERRREFVVTGGNTTKIFETLEKAFDLVAVFVSLLVVLLRINLVFARGNTSKSLPILNISEDFGGVITHRGYASAYPLCFVYCELLCILQ